MDPGAAKLMKPGGELNRRGEVGFIWVLLGGGAWAEGAGNRRVAGLGATAGWPARRGEAGGRVELAIGDGNRAIRTE